MGNQFVNKLCLHYFIFIEMSTLFVSGSVNISGTYKINGEEPYQQKVNITTEEQATGEKFLGRDVYVKGWEGTVPGSNSASLKTVTDFFPNTSCRILNYGGDVQYDNDVYIPLDYGPNVQTYKSGPNLMLNFTARALVLGDRSLRIWVKYTKE
jgi:hypothetical protein